MKHRIRVVAALCALMTITPLAHAQVAGATIVDAGGCGTHNDPPVTIGFAIVGISEAVCYGGNSGISGTVKACLEVSLPLPQPSPEGARVGTEPVECVEQPVSVGANESAHYDLPVVHVCGHDALPQAGLYYMNATASTNGDDINDPHAGPVPLACVGL